MKRSAEIPLRTAFGNRLWNTLQIPVYSGTAPNNAAYPYVIMGEADEEEFCTKVSEGDAIRIKVHIYTEEPGTDLANYYKDLVLKALSVPLQLEDNWQVVYAGLESGSGTFRQGFDVSHAVLYIQFKMWDTSY